MSSKPVLLPGESKLYTWGSTSVQNPFENRSSQEGGAYNPQIKVGLETPLVGRIWGENKRLACVPPEWYRNLVCACLLFGAWGTSTHFIRLPGFRFFSEQPWIAFAVLLAGIWAVLSTEYAIFDLRSKTYFRRDGGGLFKRTRRGSSLDIDAVVLYCEQYPYTLTGGVVIYRIVIHWKNARVPLLIVDRKQVMLPSGVPLNHASKILSLQAQRYAQALGVRYHDNSYFHSPAPQRPF